MTRAEKMEFCTLRFAADMIMQYILSNDVSKLPGNFKDANGDGFPVDIGELIGGLEDFENYCFLKLQKENKMEEEAYG